MALALLNALGLSRRVAAAGGFSPADLSPLAWWDAADAATISESSGAVSQWDDKSGNDYHMVQGTGAVQPETGTATIGGVNAIDFAAADYMSATIDLSGVTSAEVWTVAFHAADRVMLYGDGIVNVESTNGLRRQDSNTGAGIFTGMGNASDSFYDGTPAIYKNGVHQTQIVNRQDAYDAFHNQDFIETITNASLATWRAFVLSAPKDFGFDTPKRFGEVLIFDRQMSTADRNALGSHLGAKWGITWTTIV